MSARDASSDNGGGPPVGGGGDGASTTGGLFPVVYGQLRAIAEQQMSRERPGLTLQPTALVHEVYLRLLADKSATWENERHFFAAAAEAMRRILVERARRYSRHKHGGGRRREGFEGLRRTSRARSPRRWWSWMKR